MKIAFRRSAEDRLRDTPAIRRARVATIFAVTAFVVLLTAGPLSNGEFIEQLFGVALILDVALLVAFATRRIAFSLAFASVVFG